MIVLALFLVGGGIWAMLDSKNLDEVVVFGLTTCLGCWLLFVGLK